MASAVARRPLASGALGRSRALPGRCLASPLRGSGSILEVQVFASLLVGSSEYPQSRKAASTLVGKPHASHAVQSTGAQDRCNRNAVARICTQYDTQRSARDRWSVRVRPWLRIRGIRARPWTCRLHGRRYPRHRRRLISACPKKLSVAFPRANSANEMASMGRVSPDSRVLPEGRVAGRVGGYQRLKAPERFAQRRVGLIGRMRCLAAPYLTRAQPWRSVGCSPGWEGRQSPMRRRDRAPRREHANQTLA